ncbi:MAG: hypothetical protein J6P72_00495 [Firmicutes bacterium]|nr:hypothetical protein [Bacillota bacterium]
MKQLIASRKSILFGVLIIFLCFFLTSTGYLAWLYRLIDLAPVGTPELLAMGMGYFCQAVGIGAFALAAHRNPALLSRRMFTIILAIYIAVMIPSVLVRNMMGAAVFGGFANVICGIIAGFYLYYLSKTVPEHKALTFGIGYGVSAFASWILSLIGKNTVYQTIVVLFICVAFAIITVFILSRVHLTNEEDNKLPVTENGASVWRVLWAACFVVFLFSVVNQIGFSFPSSDLASGISLELSRLFYAAGLIIAGIISDKSRKYGAVLTLGALIIPFIMLVLRGEVVSATILWALSYFASGFFSVYRIILFVDLAEKQRLWFLAVFGLLFGRLGESLGTVIYSFASNQTIILVIIAALLYAVTVVLFFWLYQKLYMPEADQEKAERMRFQRFAVKHDLSPREKEILTMLLTKETTATIAEQLFVSESTVKFHVHNLLQKTGCKSRKELTELFFTD